VTLHAVGLMRRVARGGRLGVQEGDGGFKKP
jgi:hypothetical protein